MIGENQIPGREEQLQEKMQSRSQKDLTPGTQELSGKEPAASEKRLARAELREARNEIGAEVSRVKQNLSDGKKKVRSDVNRAQEELLAVKEDFELKLRQIKAHGVDNERSRKIIHVSMIGILANVALSVFKLIIGLFSHSIAIVMDGINNIADAGSSLITIIGTKLASMGPDRTHPFGYGRIEYISSMVISIIVLYAGVTSLIESVEAISSPEKPSYMTLSLLIVAACVAVKVILGRYIKKKGEELHSDSLTDIGQDSLLDSAISTTTLVAAILYTAAGISVEAWLGALISLVIIKSGVSMMWETSSRILGERADASLAREIRATVSEFDDVHSTYGLVLNNYGPDTFNGSLYVAVPDTLSAVQVDELSRRIIYRVFEKHGVVLTAVGIHSLNTQDQNAIQIRNDVVRLALEEHYVTQVHGFYYSAEAKTIRCDIIVSFNAPDRTEVYNRVVHKIQERYPDYLLLIAMDSDYSEDPDIES